MKKILLGITLFLTLFSFIDVNAMEGFWTDNYDLAKNFNIIKEEKRYRWYSEKLIDLGYSENLDVNDEIYVDLDDYETTYGEWNTYDGNLKDNLEFRKWYIYQNIETEMTYYVDQSGLEDSVVTGIIDKNIVKDEVKGLIMSLYTGDKVTITTENLKSSIRDNIEEYLKVNNLTAKEEDIELFLKEMEEVYINKITFNDKLSFISGALVKIDKLLVNSIIGVTGVVIVIFGISKFITRKYLLPVPFITSAFLIFLGNFLLHSKISIKYISFWNDSVSKVIKNIIYNISLQSIIWAVILILLSFVLIFVKVLTRKKKMS